MGQIRVFLDTSVLLSAAASEKGAARWIYVKGVASGKCGFYYSGWVEAEAYRNVGKFGARKHTAKMWLDDNLTHMNKLGDISIKGELTNVSLPEKDLPILYGAIQAKADYLLTYDINDFGPYLDKTIYNVTVLTPASFIQKYRDSAYMKSNG